MKWVVLAIVVFIVVYTFVELRYRKTAKPHEPAAEMHEREAAARLQQAGWVKLPVEVRRPVEPAPMSLAAIKHAGGGLGADLDSCFPEKPRLFKSIDEVSSPAFVRHGTDCVVYFTASMSDIIFQLGEVNLFQRGQDLMLVPTLDHLPGKSLFSRWDDARYAASFSTGTLPPGRYQVHLLASGRAAMWEIDVR